jgi:hypothetical protein
MRRKIMRAHAREGGPKLDLDPDIVMSALFAGILLLGVLLAILLYQQGRISDQQHAINQAFLKIGQNQDRLGSQQNKMVYLERRDRISSYQTAYRFCTRINVDRAVIHDLVGRQIEHLSRPGRRKLVRRFARDYLARLEEREGLPILDCEPNAIGGPAHYQGPRAQRSFVRRWQRSRLSAAEIGICKIRISTLVSPRVCLN